MRPPHFDIRFWLLALALGVVALGSAQAQNHPYPNRAIKMVVPYPAGGNADITGRVIAKKMSTLLNTPVIVENRSGANGMIGTDAVVRSAPDGYTLLMAASGPIVINPVLYAKVPYDPIKDLQPISQVLSFQYVLVVSAASSINTLNDAVLQGKAQPGKLSFGSTGIGGGGHLAGEMFSMLSGAQFNHVPYKGSAPALIDLLGGQLAFTFDTVLTASPLIQEKRLKAFAVSGPKRARSLPDIPTMQEAGFKDFDITQFVGLFAPAGTEPVIIERLNQSANQALQDTEVIEALQTKGGNDLAGNSPVEFAALIKRELTMYGALIQRADIKAE
ncbi:MAG: tripartite tricarboxylate transporter substrate binding protein [Alcaligenaceae bacterium]